METYTSLCHDVQRRTHIIAKVSQTTKQKLPHLLKAVSMKTICVGFTCFFSVWDMKPHFLRFAAVMLFTQCQKFLLVKYLQMGWDGLKHLFKLLKTSSFYTKQQHWYLNIVRQTLFFQSAHHATKQIDLPGSCGLNFVVVLGCVTLWARTLSIEFVTDNLTKECQCLLIHITNPN